MSRVPLQFLDFTKGCVLKADLLGPPSIFRLKGYRMGEKLGTLINFGGWEDWDTSVNFLELNGIYRWYDSDGGATLLAFGNDGSNYGLWRYFLESKTVSFIQQDTDFDRNAPVLFINCDSQVIHLPDGKKDSPYSTKLRNGVTRLSTQKLGLQRPTDAFTVTATGFATPLTAWIDGNGTYSWYLSYSYGTKAEPNKYGESALSDPVTLFLPTVTGSYTAIIANFTGISGLIQRINIYRTLKDGVTPYRIGYIDSVGVTAFDDNFKDINVDTSLTAPTLTGMPGPIRCGRWDTTTRRLFYFGNDGVLRATAGGFPDIHPGIYYWVVGNQGFMGNWVAILRDNIYCGKEDGIYLMTGSVPNLVPRKISDVQCRSRCSAVEMPDGIYFLGVDADKTRVYRFDGNSATSISDSITPIFENSTQDMHKRAFGVKVGYEYWLCIMTPDTRFVEWPVPYNNLLLIYDTRTGGWFPSPTQASAIAILNGPQDNNEIYITESDPTNSAAKGTFFKHNPNIWSINATQYAVGSRLYSKSVFFSRHITMAVPGILRGKDLSFEKIIPQAIRVRVRGMLQVDPRMDSYKGSETLQKAITSNITPEASEELAEVDVLGVNAPILSVGELGTLILQDTILEERLFTNINEQMHHIQYLPSVRFPVTDTRRIEVEGVEVLHNTTDKE